MSADLRLVVQSAQRDAAELAAQCRGDRLAQRGFAHARRAVEAEDRGFEVALELDDRQVFQDAFLHLVETEVVAVELFAGAGQVEIILRHVVPRQLQQQLQVGHLHRVFGHGGVQPLDLLQLLLEGLAHLLGPVLLLGRLAHLLDVGVGAVAQLVLNGAHLLLQVVVALLLVDLLLDALLNLALQIGQLLFADEYLQQLAGAGQQAGGLQQRLAVFVRKLHVGADEVDDAALRVDVLDGEGCLLGHRRRDVDDVQRHVADRIHEGLELDALQIGGRVAQGRHPGLEIGLGGDVLRDLDLLQTVQDHRQVAVGHLQYLDDPRRGADLVHVVRRGVLDIAFALQHGTQNAALGIHGAHEVDALVAAHRNGGYRSREKHRGAQREDGYDLGNLDLLHGLVTAGDDGNHVVFAVEQFGDQVHVVHFEGFYLFFAHSIQIYNVAKVTFFQEFYFIFDRMLITLHP